MNNIKLLLILLLLSGCTASVSYYNPTGPGTLYGNCNTPLNLLRFEVSDGVFFSMRAFPQKDKPGIYVSGEVEVPKGRVAQLTSSEFKFVSLIGNGSAIENLKEIKSHYAKRDESGKVVSVEERRFDAVDALIGDTLHESGFWGSINGTYSQRFFYSMSVTDFSEKSFRRPLPIGSGSRINSPPRAW